MIISSISVDSWAKGRIMVTTENDTSVHIALTEEESDRFRALASDIFYSRQKDIAKDIATAQPKLIELKPEPVEEPFVPSAPAPLDDDIPF